MNIVDVLALSVKGYKVDEINELKDIIKKYPDAEGTIMELAKKVSFTDLQSYMKIAEDSSGAANADSKEDADNKDQNEPDQETAPKKSEQQGPDIDYKKLYDEEKKLREQLQHDIARKDVSEDERDKRTDEQIAMDIVNQLF
jgi:hypothetical protein